LGTSCIVPEGAFIDQIVIEHPENIAFDPGRDGTGGSSDFNAISRSLWVHSTFEAVTSVALVDTGQQVA
jgi:hypothetical protein